MLSSRRALGLVERPVQPWAAVAGWAALLLPLPSIAWRLAMLAGLPTGFAYPELYRGSADGVLYVLGLELVQLLAAVLAFGLIRRWGEVVPRGVPGVGGRTIPWILPTVLGAVGAVVLAAIMVLLLLQFWRVGSGQIEGWLPADGMNAIEATVLYIAYVPFFLWPIAIAVAVVGYGLRRRPRVSPGV